MPYFIETRGHHFDLCDENDFEFKHLMLVYRQQKYCACLGSLMKRKTERESVQPAKMII